MELIVNKCKIQIVQGDITERSVDCIVNAANSYLQHGGGVAGAIIRKGGHIIQEESNKIGFVPVGNAVMTGAGNLSCKKIIHAVGPKMGQGDEDVKLQQAIQSILALASQEGFSSISIPAISSGIYGFPKDRCAKILITQSHAFLRQNKTSLSLVEFCIYDDETLKYFEYELNLAKTKAK